MVADADGWRLAVLLADSKVHVGAVMLAAAWS